MFRSLGCATCVLWCLDLVGGLRSFNIVLLCGSVFVVRLSIGFIEVNALGLLLGLIGVGLFCCLLVCFIDGVLYWCFVCLILRCMVIVIVKILVRGNH